MTRTIFSLFTIFLKGISQIMLQEKAVTGIFFLAGIFYSSVVMGIAAIVSVCCGTIIAKILNFNPSEIKKGLYGFSPALTGVALLLFFKPDIFAWIFVVAGSVAAAFLQHLFLKKKIPVFTLPFVLVTWIIFYSNHVMPILTLADINTSAQESFDYSFAFSGFGQVIFQEKVVSGILFFAGVFISSPIAGIFGFFGSLLGGYLALWIGVPIDSVALGLFSFNAVLSAIAFAAWNIRNFAWAFIAVVISVFISIFMIHFNMIQLTFPFVAATCICLELKKHADLFLLKRKV